MTADLNKKDCIRGMIDQRLKSVASAELLNVAAGLHIDEDTIAAFIEGRLADAECQPVLSHLAGCGLCRRASAQFVQLENQIDSDTSAAAGDEEPGRLEALLARLRSAVPAASEEVVFAYENPEGEEKTEPSRPTKTNEHEASDER